MTVVFSPNLVLPNAGRNGPNGNNPLIGYKNIVTLGGVTASSELSDFPATNVVNPATDLMWRASSADDVTFDVENSTNAMVNYVGIAGHNFGSAEIAVTIAGDDGSGFEDLTLPVIPGHNGPMLFRLPDTYGMETIRVSLVEGNAAPAMAVVYVGQLLVLQRRMYVGHTPINYGRSVDVINGISESGNYLGSIIVGEVRETQVELQNLTPDWYRAHLDPFIAVGKTTPCFFAWRPQQYPDEVGYCWITNNPKPVNQRSNGMMAIAFDLRGVA